MRMVRSVVAGSLRLVAAVIHGIDSLLVYIAEKVDGEEVSPPEGGADEVVKKD